MDNPNKCLDPAVEAADPVALGDGINPKVQAALAREAAGTTALASTGTVSSGYGGGGCSTCEFEAPQAAWFYGHLHYDLFDMDWNPNRIISTRDGAYVCLHWWVAGELARLICGRWCVKVYLENLGRDTRGCDDITLIETVGTLRCNNGDYWLCVHIPPDCINPDMCSCVYQLAVSIQLLDKCCKPVPFAGFCKGPLIQFYDPS